MLVKAVVFLCLVASTYAEVGSNCTGDTDCEQVEFCFFPEEAEYQEYEPRGGERFSRFGGEEEQDGEEQEPEGECVEKFKLYDHCQEDKECESEVCLTGPVPGSPGLTDDKGKCVECKTDDDCGGSTFCSHPVINAQCIRSVLFGLTLHKAESKASEDKQSGGGSSPFGGAGPFGQGGPFGGQGGGRGQGRRGHGGRRGQQSGGVNFSQVGAGGASSGGQDAGQPENQLLHLLQLISVSGNGGEDSSESGTSNQQSANLRRSTFDSRQSRYPNFPTQGGRQKRDVLSPYFINKPGFTCSEKKPNNSPCQRSPECRSDKCSIEGQCLA